MPSLGDGTLPLMLQPAPPGSRDKEESSAAQGLGERASPEDPLSDIGHEYTPENSYLDPRGFRQCRTCRAERVKSRQVPPAM